MDYSGLIIAGFHILRKQDRIFHHFLCQLTEKGPYVTMTKERMFDSVYYHYGKEVPDGRKKQLRK
jgi:hypothetical protein